MSPWHIVSLWELSYFLEGILNATYVFQEGDRLRLFQNAHASKLKKHVYI